ncbi:MAG: STAS domain-containing protein [Clostridia bacterium]|nr:STAS domain-containing protein [Clostridia bacterium]
MTIEKRENGDTTTIAVEGRLNTTTANEFGNEVKNLIGSVQNLVFDFDKVEYISSTGLRVLLFAQKEMNKRGSMKIINVSEEVYDVMKDVGFTGISEIYMKE